MENKLRIGIIGLGTVGCGVVKVLSKMDDVEIICAAVKNTAKKREVELNCNKFMTQSRVNISIAFFNV